MGVVDGLYECPCGYKSKEKSHMKRHMNKKKLCGFTDNKDVENFFIGKKRISENISHLSNEEKKERLLTQCTITSTKYNKYGNMNEHQLSKKILHSLKNCSIRRKHGEVYFSDEDIIKLLNDNKVYVVHNTILGDIEFPMILTNGYYNTPSFDRIDDEKQYSYDNIEIRPHFLNTTYKLTTNCIKELIKLREEDRNTQELINIAKNISILHSNDNFFYTNAKSIKQSSKSRKKERNFEFNFKNLKELTYFLISLYIKQGGRCAYTNVPIYPEKLHKFKLSPERINPMLGYSKENLVLIVVGLNGPVSGQYLNKNLDNEEQIDAMNVGKFNQKYWDDCTKMTENLFRVCNDIKENEKIILLNNISNDVKLAINDYCET